MALAFPLLFLSCKEAWDSLSYSEKEIQKQWTVRVAECPALKVLGCRLEAEDGRWGMRCDEFFSILNL